MSKYNDKFSAEDQVDTEEAIAAHIFNESENLDADAGESFTEEQCNAMGKTILLKVLAKFRPDLMEKPQ